MARLVATAGIAALLGCGFDASGSGGSAWQPESTSEAMGTTSGSAVSEASTTTDGDTRGASDESTTGGPSDPVVSVDGCVEATDDCTCVPLDGAHACVHTMQGGAYPNLGCSSGYQCCDGAWRRGPGGCGPCLCTEPTGEQGCDAPEGATMMCHPRFSASSEPIPPDVQEDMTGQSWKEHLDCPPFSELRLLHVNHWTFEGTVAEGELVVHDDVVDDLVGVFGKLFEARFPIARIERIETYGADADASMAANNTSAFNCRTLTDGETLSQHSHGTAVDINPVQNPYVRDENVHPPAGTEYLMREHVRPGMIVDPGPVVAAFDAIEWSWGGRWMTLKDYQHFQSGS